MNSCPKCGAALDSEGMCAMCMLAGGLGTELPTVTSLGATPSGAGPAEALDYDSFGPYRILRVLGEGGMGAVYLAEQTEPLKRQVALKVVKLGLDSSQILSRFNYERQALALMDHPNIAHVYDAGASEKGRPYFVMEFVDGLPITQYSDQHRLNTAERLELFVPVCQALQHAHQKGVIHRDIKPSNVMVTEQDGRPIPKVIDFGIAKATDQRAVENAAFTNLGQFIGTPEYMSPEQADVLSGDIDTSSDVYSLGVLLYELLIGAVPFDAHMLRKAGLSELLRIIREDEAIPMTAKLTGMGATATAVAGCRRTDPSTLRRQVTGDLNWIVMKAMEKDRQRRYPAVSELAADIRRHLDVQPVLASPPSTMYRTRKFVRRHKAGVIAAAVVLVALVGGIVATSWEAQVARRERGEAVAARALAEQRSKETVAERNRAEEQTALAVRQEEVAELQRTIAEARLGDVHTLADSMLFEINDDVKDLPGGTKAREALVRLGQQYLNKEATVVQADPHRRQELAEAFIKVGELQGSPGESNLRDIAGARESYGRGVDMLQSEVRSSPRDAHLRHLMTLAYLRQPQLDETESKTKYERAAKSAEIFVAHWPKDPQGLRDRAEVLQAKGENAVAEELRERILAQNPHDPVLRWELGKAQLALGGSLTDKNNQNALEWLQKAVDAFEALNREDPSNVQYQRDRAVALIDIQALRYLKSSLAHSEALMQADSASQANHNSYNDSLRSVLHQISAMSSTVSPLPDYRPFFTKQKQTSSNMGREVVLGWREHLRDMNAFSIPISERLEAVRKALELGHRLVSSYPDQANSEALAVALKAAGDVYFEAARLTRGEESMAAYRQSHACCAEAKGIMQPLKDSKARGLPIPETSGQLQFPTAGGTVLSN